MRKAAELLVYVGVGIGLVAGVLGLAVLRPNISGAQFHVWFLFIVMTAFLLYALVKMYWSARRVRNVWPLLGLFMAAHTVGYVILLRHVSDWPGLWYVFTIPIEIMLFATIARLWLKVNPPNVKF